MDVEPNPPPRSPPTPPPGGAPLPEPSEFELLFRSGIDLAGTPARAARYAAAVARRFVKVGPQLLKNGGAMSGTTLLPPATSFNGLVGARRSLSFVSVSLADVKAVRRSLDVTVNDVVVALSAGALVRYLDEVGEAAAGQVVDGVGAGVHAWPPAIANSPTGSQASFTASIAPTSSTQLSGFRAISRSIEPGKKNARAFQTSSPLPSTTELLPPASRSWPPRGRCRSSVFARWAPVGMNTIVSNIMGPPRPLYVAGAKVTGIYSTSVVMLKMGINFTVFSCDGRIDFGITVDPELVSDPWLIADAIPLALEELMAASGVGPPRPVIDAGRLIAEAAWGYRRGA